MNGLDRQHLLAALTLLAMALFVSSGHPAAGGWRRLFRLAAIVCFAVAVAAALVDVALWAAGLAW